MSRAQNDQELRVRGLGLAARFAITTTIALAIVMGGAGLLLVTTTTTITERARQKALVDAVALSAAELRPGNVEQQGSMATMTSNAAVRRFGVEYGAPAEGTKGTPAYVYRGEVRGNAIQLLVPIGNSATGHGLIGLIAGITLAVIVAGALVAFIVASRVARPLESIVNDIRQIARGQLQHRSRVKGGAEITLLSRAINRMAEGLEEAQDAEVELSVREREMEVADEVRDALRPVAAPERDGYDIAAIHIGSPQPGGDFHDFIEFDDGRVGLLVCGVSGQGVPGALIGATARAYLRSELSKDVGVADALRHVNAALSHDVRRGMYITAMFVQLDPAKGEARIACAGHKVPCLRISGSDGKMRTIQPEGIALGFDKGPVFDSRIQTERIELEVGDRLVISNTGPMSATGPEGKELGERNFYRLVLQNSKLGSAAMLEALENSILAYADEEPLPNDISIVTLARIA